MEKKSIYIMCDGERYKIGISNNPQKRVKELLVGNPSIKLIYESEKTENARQIESRLHKIYKDVSCGREWFLIKDIEKVKKEIEEFIKEVKKNIVNKEEKENEEISKKLYNFLFGKIEEKIEIIDKSNKEIDNENKLLKHFTEWEKGEREDCEYIDLIYKTIFNKTAKELRKEKCVNSEKELREKLDYYTYEIICSLEDMIKSMIICNAFYVDIEMMVKKCYERTKKLVSSY